MDRAMSLLEERRSDGLPMQRSWYRMVISHLFEHGRMDDGFRYLEDLAKQKVRTTTNNVLLEIVENEMRPLDP